MPSTKKEVETFLRNFKNCWPPYCYVVPRDKNDEALFSLGITYEQRKEVILSLKYENYHKGPEPDDSGGLGEIWIFRKRVTETELYIKLKIIENMGMSFGKCISFHPSEYWGE